MHFRTPSSASASSYSHSSAILPTSFHEPSSSSHKRATSSLSGVFSFLTPANSRPPSPPSALSSGASLRPTTGPSRRASWQEGKEEVDEGRLRTGARGSVSGGGILTPPTSDGDEDRVGVTLKLRTWGAAGAKRWSEGKRKGKGRTTEEHFLTSPISTRPSSRSSLSRTLLASSPKPITILAIFVFVLLAASIWPSSGPRTKPATISLKNRSKPMRVQTGWDSPERDTIVLYTILGSDLPPRHSPNQTLSNLDFLIQNENLTLPSCLSFPSLSPSFPNAHPIPKLNLKRHFILNRLQPSPSRTAILSLLASHSLPFSEIPFVDASYRSQPFRWDGLSSGGGRWGLGGSGVPDSFYTGHVAQEALRQSGGEEMREIEVGRAGWKELDWALHSKNLYAMHNNGGRNEALRMAFGEEGEEDIWDREGRRRRTRWAIPLDSNCAFTPAGAVGLVESIVQVEEERARMKAVADDGEQVEGENKKEEGKEYVVVPMARLLGNEEFFKWNSEPDWKVLDRLERGEEKRDREMDRLLEDRRPSAPAEPQIAFRWTSPRRFSPSFRYGRRPKLSLLWDMGWLPFSRSLHRLTHPWELPDRTITASSFASLRNITLLAPQAKGWTVRLFSGEGSLEAEDAEGMGRRAGRRLEGIVRFLEGLDVRLGEGEKEKDEHGGDSSWGHRGGERKLGWGWGLGEQGDEKAIRRKWERLLLEGEMTSYGPVETPSESDVVGYGFPQWSTPDVWKLWSPTEYMFDYDPLRFSLHSLLAFLSSHPPETAEPFVPLLHSHLHYLLYSPAALALSTSNPFDSLTTTIDSSSSSSTATPSPSISAIATYDDQLLMLATFLSRSDLISRVSTRIGLRIQILLAQSASSQPSRSPSSPSSPPHFSQQHSADWRRALSIWERAGTGLVEGGWEGWTFLSGEWEIADERGRNGGRKSGVKVDWEGLKRWARRDGLV